MKIGFDLQPLQTEQSRNRGIGRFTTNIINSIINKGCNDSFLLFSNGNYKEPIHVDINEKCKLLTLPYVYPKNDGDKILNDLIQFISYQNNNLEILQICSPFEGYPSNLPVISSYLDRLKIILSVVIHDFIPLHYPEHYLSNHLARKAYFRQLKTVYDADMLFAVSESTRKDAINLLGIHPNKVIFLGEAAASSFYKINNLSNDIINKIKKKYGIKQKFVLYVGGIEFRKNVEKSIIAFSKMDKKLLDVTSYVLVCEILDADKKRLMELAKSLHVDENLILSGYLSDEELNILYNCCDTFIFPSLIEGFGLPILEAMQCGAPVIGSDSSSMSELIEDKEYLFDPLDEQQITLMMSKMLIDEKYRQRSSVHSLTRCKDYSWNSISQKMIDTYRIMYDKISYDDEVKNIIHKPKIAFFSPLPPKKSGISDYSASLLRRLSRFWEIDIFIDDNYRCNDDFITSNFDVYSYHDFENLKQLRKYDSIVYQVGNSDNHAYMFDLIRKYPGVVVLHDIFLSGVIYWITAKVGKLDEFIEEVIYSHGDYGKELVEKAKRNQINWDYLIWNLQVNKRFLDNATEVIVHSEWDRKNILDLYPQYSQKISLVHQFAPLRQNESKEQKKKKLGFSGDDFIICSFGFVVQTKKIDSIVKNLSQFLQNHENCKYLIVGDASDPYGQTVKKLVEDLNLQNKVIFTNFIGETEYKNYLDICDVCISLRTNARAGTSASVNHALGSGLPTVISDEGPFSDFPDDVVIKVKADDEKNLGSIVDDLYGNKQKRNLLSKKAKEFAEKHLSLDSCVKKYVNAVEKSMKQNSLVKI